MRAKDWIKNSCLDRRGSSAVEFAFLLPAFLGCIVGGLYAAMGVSIANSIQFAVEQGARCAAMGSASCRDGASTITYTQNHYTGPASPVPSFTFANAACGYRVSASINYGFDFALTTVNLPITATSCFPG